MLNRPIEKFWLNIFYVFSAIALACGFLSIYLEEYVLMLIPAALLFLYLSINDFRFIYFLLIAMIPLSTEVALPGGFATDFPTEPLIAGLMLLFLGFILAKPDLFDKEFLKSPVIFLVIIHYCWIVISTIYSSNPIVSLKFTLAKTWYIITFVFLTSMIIKNIFDFRIAFWCLLIPLLFTACYTLIRHASDGFTFESVNVQMLPFFRNHVNYACTLAEIIPFLVLFIGWYKKKTFARRFLVFSFLVLMVAIYFAYTRSAWLSLLAALVIYFVIRLRLLKWLLGAGLVLLVGFFIYMASDNNYLNYEPDFEHTIYHPELEDHLLSTFEGEDVSSAERVYRWVAGVRMWLSKPWTGYGPGNFYNFYRPYTVTGFQTYVSANPEKSSIHNYFLLLLTEQGVFGLLIFGALTIVLLLTGENIYHRTIPKQEKRYAMAIVLCLVIIYVNTFLSDLIETDKIGSLYFICIALLINQGIRNRRQAALPALAQAA